MCFFIYFFAAAPGTRAFTQKIIQDTNIEMIWELYTSAAAAAAAASASNKNALIAQPPPLYLHPDLKVHGQISDVEILMCESQFQLLRAVVEENVCDTFDKKPVAGMHTNAHV